MIKEEFIKKAKQIHGDKYDYSLVPEKVLTREKIKIICPVHGVFEQIVNEHINKKHGCRFCGRILQIKATTKSVEQFIERAKQVHGNKYDYSLVEYKNNKTKVKILCKKCGKIFEQKPKDHITNKQGCPNCLGTKKLTTKRFIERAKQVHGDKYDYSKFNYINARTKGIIICPIHGEFEQNSINHITNKQGCPICKLSHGEEYIRNVLLKNNIIFEEQKTFDDLVSKKGRKLKYDFYLPNKNLLIEFNGIQHYRPVDLFGGEKTFKAIRQRDFLKEKYAKENNIELLYFTDKNIKTFEDKILT